MSAASISIPKEVFADLDLHDRDILEGQARRDSVEVHAVRRASEVLTVMTAEQFVEKWRGQFPDVTAETDPRLNALLQKHAKPS